MVLTTPIDLNISYPNSIILVSIVDLESCNEHYCFGWLVRLYSPVNIEYLSLSRFASCLANNLKVDIGTFFRVVFSGIGGLWQPYDVKKCQINEAPKLSLYSTKSTIGSSGLSVMLLYPNGTMHVGRMKVVIGEFI